MNVLVFFLLTVMAGVFQVAFFDRVRIFGAGPDFFLALTVIAAVNLDAPGVLIIGVLNGLLKDIFDIVPLGVNGVIFPLMALAVSRLNRTLSLENTLACSLITGIAVVAVDCAAWIILSYSQIAVPRGVFLRVIFLEALLTAAVIPLLFAVTRAPIRSTQ